jgi:uncharacterized protein YdcH (DUF465 family)
MERHDLLHEFPEYQEKIHKLKIYNSHFRELFDEYHKLEHEIHRVNTGVEITSDNYAHTLKTKLLYMKDELVSILEAH